MWKMDKFRGNTQILTLDEVKEFIETNPGILLGDADLIGQDVQKVDFLKEFHRTGALL